MARRPARREATVVDQPWREALKEGIGLVGVTACDLRLADGRYRLATCFTDDRDFRFALQFTVDRD